jgi:hypothetical protein
MPRVERFDHEFVDQIPEDLDEGILYVSMRFGMVIHLCACGCGNQTVTPLGPTDYKLIYDGETITLHPSVGNWNFPCRSHYWVRRAKVVWADDWTDDQIRAGRAHDRYVKDQMFCEPHVDAGGAVEAETLEDLHGSTAEVAASGLRDFAKRIAVYFRRRGRRHDGSGSQHP